MKSIFFLLLLLFPGIVFSQERLLGGAIPLQNQLPEALRELNLGEDVFSLHAENLQAEQGVKCLFPTLKNLSNDLLFLPELSENFARSAINSRLNLITLSQLNFRLSGNVAGGFGPPLPDVPSSEIFINSAEELHDQIKKLETEINLSFKTEADKRNWEKLPFEFQAALVKYLLACRKTEPILESFCEPVVNQISGLKTPGTNEVFEKLMIPWQNRQLENFDWVKPLEEIDLARLAFSTRIMGENLQSLLRFNGVVDNSFAGSDLLSKYGEISVFGNRKDTIVTDKFISIDFGGDDLYRNNCGSNIPLQNYCGLLVDYSGNDVYKKEVGLMNSGVLGLSFLFDFKGDDKYFASQPGLAFSLFGTSVLCDFNGNDYYSNSENYGQGAAIAGNSVLLDLDGDDKYFCKSYSQGFGGTLGCGLLLYIKGNDVYSGIPENLDFSNPVSFIQGASCGRWAEATDGQSLAGGFGFFVDGAGTDQYYAGSFSQGSAYYFGAGFFNDFSGDDSYNAISHSQGYGVHFALGNFCDYLGDDRYNEKSDRQRITQILGGGRDNSGGLFSDLSGDDTYFFGNRSLGIGDMRGTGCFYDPQGTNSFFWVENTINRNAASIGQIHELMSPTSGFRLYNNTKNWNSCMVLLKGRNTFQKEVEGNFQQLIVTEKNEIDTNLKTLVILKK